jgi:hypothetical protein
VISVLVSDGDLQTDREEDEKVCAVLVIDDNDEDVCSAESDALSINDLAFDRDLASPTRAPRSQFIATFMRSFESLCDECVCACVHVVDEVEDTLDTIATGKETCATGVWESAERNWGRGMAQGV